MSCGVSNASEIEELSFIKELHLRFDPLSQKRNFVQKKLYL